MHSMYLAVCRSPDPYYGNRSTSRPAPSDSLVTSAIVANHCAIVWVPCPLSSQGSGESFPPRVAGTVVDGVMPVIIMIGVLSVPTAIMRLERVVRPTLASVSPGYCNSLSPEPQCPYIGRVRVSDSGLNRRRRFRLR